MSDCCRTLLKTTFECAECGSELTLNYSKSRTGASSACELNSHIFINPCAACKSKYSKPALLIKQAVELTESI